MEKNNLGFERQLNSDGSKNAKYVDLLEEDKPIAGQKFACACSLFLIDSN